MTLKVCFSNQKKNNREHFKPRIIYRRNDIVDTGYRSIQKSKGAIFLADQILHIISLDFCA